MGVTVVIVGATALKLVKSLGYQMSEIYGHGEVSTNKQPSEGKTCKAFIRKNWNKQESELSLSSGGKDEIDPKDLKLLDMLGIDIKKLKTQFKSELSKVVKDILSKKSPIKEDIDRINDVMKKIL